MKPRPRMQSATGEPGNGRLLDAVKEPTPRSKSTHSKECYPLWAANRASAGGGQGESGTGTGPALTKFWVGLRCNQNSLGCCLFYLGLPKGWW